MFGDKETTSVAVTANFPRSIEEEKVKELMTIIAGVAIVLGVLTSLVSFVLSAKINRPIQQIITYIDRIAKGDVPEKITD